MYSLLNLRLGTGGATTYGGVARSVVTTPIHLMLVQSMYVTSNEDLVCVCVGERERE